MTHHQLEPGTLVDNAAGCWLGIAGPRKPHGAYLVVQKGRLLTHDLSPPATARAGIDGAGVTRHRRKSDLHRSRYGHPVPIGENAPSGATPAEAV